MPASRAFSITVPRPESSETSTSRRLPTSAGSTCSKVCGVGAHAGRVHARLVRERVLADVGLGRVGRAVEQLVDEVRGLGQPRQPLRRQQLDSPSSAAGRR